jgi:hypothetical protein
MENKSNQCIDPITLLNLDPNSEKAKEIFNKLKTMKKPEIVDKKETRGTQIARFFTGILLIGIGFLVEKYFPESTITGDWKTGGVLIGSGAGILGMVFILMFANKALDLFERFYQIKKGD